MWSYSSCAKLHQKYNVLTVFFLGIKALCTALADNAWLTVESRRKFNKIRLDALSIPKYVIKKGPHHGARHGQTKNKKSTMWPGIRGRDAARKSTLKVNILQVSTIDFSEIQFDSQLAIGWTEQKCKEWDELAKENHTCHLTPKEKTRFQGQWYLTLNKAGKNGPMKLRSVFRAAVSMKNRLHYESQNKLKSLSIQNNTVDGILFQAHRGGTSLNGIGNELIRFFLIDLLFVTVGFVYSRFEWFVDCGGAVRCRCYQHEECSSCTSYSCYCPV